MKFVPVREFRLHPGSVWRKLKEDQELILTSRGKPVGLLAPLSEESFDRTLRVWRQARGMVALALLQDEAKRKGLGRLAPSQIQEEIRQVRHRMRRESAA